MKEYLIRVGDDGMVTDLLGLEEDEGMQAEELDPCDECQQLEAAMLAIISGLREEIGMLKARVRDLEKGKQLARGGFITEPMLLRI